MCLRGAATVSATVPAAAAAAAAKHAAYAVATAAATAAVAWCPAVPVFLSAAGTRCSCLPSSGSSSSTIAKRGAGIHDIDGHPRRYSRGPLGQREREDDGDDALVAAGDAREAQALGEEGGVHAGRTARGGSCRNHVSLDLTWRRQERRKTLWPLTRPTTGCLGWITCFGFRV